MTDIIVLRPVTIDEIPLQAIKVLSSHLFTYMAQAANVKLRLFTPSSYATSVGQRDEEGSAEDMRRKRAPLVARQLMQCKLLFILNEEASMNEGRRKDPTQQRALAPYHDRIASLIERLSTGDGTLGQLKKTCEGIIIACDDACMRASTATNAGAPIAANANRRATDEYSREPASDDVNFQDPLGLTIDQVWTQLTAQLFFQ